MIYLDFNRTTPIAPSVLESMQPFWATHFMLPGQEHPQATAVGEALQHARDCVAMLVGCESFELVFTSGGTESNNLGILGAASAGEKGHVLVSAVEHDSVMLTVESLREQGWEIEIIPCDANGLVDVDDVRAALRDDTRLACVQLASGVTGVVQPIREIADACHDRGVHLHCDATQAFGKMPVDVTALRADTVTVCGHRIYGPKGSGAIFVRRGLHLSPIMHGESREMGLRPGSENIPAIIGLGAAANLAARCCDDAADNLCELRDRFVAGLQSAMHDEITIVSEDAPRLPNTVAIELPVNAQQVQRFARELVMATAQSVTPPDEITRTLAAIGKSDSQIARTLRVSLGWTTSREQVDRSVNLIAEAADMLAV